MVIQPVLYLFHQRRAQSIFNAFHISESACPSAVLLTEQQDTSPREAGLMLSEYSLKMIIVL